MPIRLRLAAGAALVTLLIFGVGGVVFATRFKDGQVDSIDRGLRTQADTLIRRLREPGTSASLGGDSAAVAPGEVVAQILDRSGAVVDSTREAGSSPVVDVPAVRAARSKPVFTDVEIGREREPFRVIVRSVGTGGEIAVVGMSLEETTAAVDRVERGLVVAGGLAVTLAALGGWLIAGLALRPVDRMRREAADLSEHDAEAQLHVPGTRDEIAALAVTMNAMLTRLQSALRRQRELVADAGHELRTPLAVLRAELELADRPGRTTEELRDAVRHASTEAERLSRLADTLLFLARCDTGNATVHRTDVALSELVDDTLAAWSGRASEASVTLHAAADAAAVSSIDPDLVRRALDNLLDNALRFGPVGSTVTVTIAAETAGVQLSVVDEGPGFPPDFLPHAFERFRRADDARARHDGGAGLGLALVDAVARAHGGSVTAGNNPSGGARVSVYLPTT